MNRFEKSRIIRAKVMEHLKKDKTAKAATLVRLYGCSKGMAYDCMRASGIEVLSLAEVRKRNGPDKFDGIVKYLKTYGSKRASEVEDKFNCGRRMAIQAFKNAGIDPLPEENISHKAGYDSTMYRPGGVNYLTVSWLD